MSSNFDPNLKYCVIDENIWIHALNLCDPFDKYCLNSLRLFDLYSACPYKIKMIVNRNYQQIIISKLKNIQNECKDSDSQIRFNFLYPLITKDYQRLEYFTDFDIHHPNQANYDNFYRDFECQIKYDDYYLIVFYLSKEQESIIITNDDDVLEECKNIGFRVNDAKGAVSDYQC